MNERPLDKLRTLSAYLPYDAQAVTRRLSEALSGLNRKIVVLDDDPTGVQTVHNVYVYTDWSEASILSGFLAPEKIFFILVNSRGFGADQTRRAHTEIAQTVMRVARETGQNFLIISRSDSTLRGHYPLETEALRAALEQQLPPIDGEVILPFFKEGGRYTVNNVHYVAAGDTLIPAGQTEFARDKTFGYQSSDLREWVQEKTRGAHGAQDVMCIPLEWLRACDYDRITDALMETKGFNKVVVNAIDYLDVCVFVSALCAALAKGKHFLFRSAAALTKVIGGVPDKPLLTREDLVNTENTNGGLIVVGSHVKRTTEQLEALRGEADIEFVEFDQRQVISPQAFKVERARVIALAERCIKAGKTVAVFTRRERFDLDTGDKEAELQLSVKISDAVSGIVDGLETRPNFIIAKGGITSSDVGTKGLHVKKALVLGQILPGVPVWLTGAESKFPNMPYVIFPGNVGDENALMDAVRKMRPKR